MRSFLCKTGAAIAISAIAAGYFFSQTLVTIVGCVLLVACVLLITPKRK